MMTVPELTADALGSFLAKYMQRRYGSAESRLVELVPSIARIAMECIGTAMRSTTMSSTPCWSRLQVTTFHAAERCMPTCHPRIMRI